MNRLGHIGFALLVLSPIAKIAGADFVVLAAILGLLPDIDIVLRVKHREYTHNFTLAAVAALLIFPLSLTASLAAFVGVSLHIAADLLTKQKFPPFFPFSRKRYALGIFRSDNAVVNATLFILGALAFIRFAGGWWR